MNIWPFSHHKAEHCGVLIGDGKFAFPIVGESHYQQELEKICGHYPFRRDVDHQRLTVALRKSGVPE